jgi:lipopolysaccharide biosynthesis glycosyltransferase
VALEVDDSKVLVTLANAAWLEHAKQVFSAAVHKAKWRGQFLLLAHDVSPNSCQWFDEKGIHVRACNELFTSKSRWQSVVFSKYYLFAPEMKRWRKVVFVECDTLIRSSLEPLTQVSEFSAVPTPFSAIRSWSNHFSSKPSELAQQLTEILPPGLFFNSGVMAFDTNCITQNALDELLALTGKYLPLCRLPEQAILNIYFRGRWEHLDSKFNLLRNVLLRECDSALDKEYVETASREAVILHLSGQSSKPWSQGSPFYNEWLSNLRQADRSDFTKPTEGLIDVEQ